MRMKKTAPNSIICKATSKYHNLKRQKTQYNRHNILNETFLPTNYSVHKLHTEKTGTAIWIIFLKISMQKST